MIRIVMFFLAICIAWPMTPVGAVPADIVMVACHDDGSQNRHNAPGDPQSQHICLGCAVPAFRIDLANPLPAPRMDSILRAAWRLKGKQGGVDPPPPRAEG